MKKKDTVELPVVNLNAAAIDVGSKEHWVAVGQQPEDVRQYGVYTSDHLELIKWLADRKVKTIALEATGSYWQTLFSALQSYGFEVLLTSTKYIKNPAGKTDVKDCRWLQKLHSLGLLQGCFLPSEEVEKLRHFHRHRTNLQEDSTRCVLRMQKAMQLMNLRLEVAISDITGISGMRIIAAILEGERNGEKLAALAARNVKKSKKEIAAALEGNWKEELLYLLRDEFEIYNMLLVRISRCDTEIEKLLQKMASTANNQDPDSGSIALTKKKRQFKQINANVSKLGYQYFGVDLMSIEGVSYNTVMTLIAEVGNDIFKFPTSKKFAKWLRLSPDNRISGNKVISSRTPKGKNVLANALRNAANTISQKKEGSLKKFFSRIAFKKGRAAAITATARKIAVIMWNMIVKKQIYNPMIEEEYSLKIRGQVISNLKKKMKQLNIMPDELYPGIPATV